jgi:hypothetical protein
MLDKIRSVLRQVVGGAKKLRNVLALSDASIKLLRFVSDDVWGSMSHVVCSAPVHLPGVKFGRRSST